MPEEEIELAFQEEGLSLGRDDDQEEDVVYTPAVTLWAFLSQMLHRGEQRSCTAAVSPVVVLLVDLGRKPYSANTGAYCRARAKLPEPVIRRLTLEMAGGCMAPREVWTHLLTYNLIRRAMLQSAMASGLSPRELSFMAALQSIATSWAVAALLDSRTFGLLVNAHLSNLSGHRVGDRPDRMEPRAIKRRRETTPPVDRASCPSPRRTPRRRLDVNPYGTSGSAIQFRPLFLLSSQRLYRND